MKAVRQRHLFFPFSDNYNSPRCLTLNVTTFELAGRIAG